MGRKGDILKTSNLIKLTAIAAFAFAAIIGTANVAFAQRDRRDDDRNDRNDRKRDDKAEKARAKAEQARIRAEQQRQAYWNAQNARVRAQQQRQSTWNNRNNNQTGVTLVIGSNNNYDQNARYRVYRNGSYYQTDYRGAQLLQQAVNEGYRQGFQAGRNDRNSNRRISWSNSNVYRSGNYGYQSHVTRSQYQYYFQQGFQRGYQDGSNSRWANDYNGEYEYGYYENGSVNILGAILNTVLNIRSY